MSLVDIIFPKYCLGCKTNGRYLCAKCINKVPFSRSICPMCGKASIDGVTHTSCKKPLGMDGLTSLWCYQGVIKKGIKALKYKYAKEVAVEFGSAFTYFFEKSDKVLPKNLVLIPIPLHTKRENWRGFNQSEVVGDIISKQMKMKCMFDVLVRSKRKTPQAELKNREVRLKNAQGIFSLNSKYKILDTRLLLFDDVWTTGATMREAAKVLKRNGAKEVWGLTLAH